MAERRMFAKTIVLSDAFLDMPLSARCLYFTLGMFADDDGFVNAPKGIMRQCGATEDDMKLLLAKKFILSFESGIIVIKHWRINNYLRNDRYIPTKYQDEKDAITLDENGSYCQKNTVGIPGGIPTVYRRDGIPRLGKDRLGKDSIENNNIQCEKKVKEVKHRYGEYQNVKLTEKQYDKLLDDYGKDTTDMAIQCVDDYCQEYGKKYNDYNLTIRKWGIESAKKKKTASGTVVNATNRNNTNDWQ